MAIDKIFDSGSVDGIADNLFNSVSNSVSEVKAMQQRKAAENVQLVVQALKKIESDIQDKYDGVTTVIEKRVASIKDGRDGQNGADGRAGKDGRPGRDGAIGPRGANGVDGRNGRDGENGVSVTDANIDFDGSLIISLSNGRVINVGEVVAPDLAETIKVITNGGGTSQQVLDTLVSLQNQINVITTGVTYEGTWNASTNTPTLTSSAGTTNGFYIVSVAGSTTLNGTSNWGVGDWAIFNGSIWQRVEGGASGNFVDLSASGTVTLSGLTASTALALDASKNIVSVTNTGTGNNVLATSPTLVTPALGTPSSATLTNATGLPISTGVSGLGTGIATALAVNTGSSGAPVLFGGSLGTPSSGTVTNLTGTASININGTVGATTASTGAFTTLTTSSTVTLNGGTANGVTYLNGSKVVTSGSALTFDGAALTVDTHINVNGGDVRFDDDRFVYSYSGGSVGQYRAGFYLDGAGTNIRHFINNAEAMRLTTTGLGIGTSSPAYKLQVGGTGSQFALISTTDTTSTTGLLFGDSGSNTIGRIEYVHSSDLMQFYINGSTRATIDSSGNLGIATTSPLTPLQINSFGGLDGNANQFYLTNNYYYDPTDARDESIKAGYSHRIVLDNNAGGILFQTTSTSAAGANTAITLTTRATIDSSGRLLVGATSSVGSGFSTFQYAGATYNGISVVQTDNSSGSRFMNFIANSASCGVIDRVGTTSAVVYTATSDYRLKNVTGAVTGQGARIDALKPIDYQWKENNLHARGFLAHEFQTVYPNSVTGTKDALDKDGNPKYQAIQASSSEVIADLVAEIQSLRVRVAQLESN